MTEPQALMVGPIEGPILPLAAGAPFPQAATVRAFLGEDRIVTLRLRVRDGRPVLVELTVGSHEPAGPQFAAILERTAPEVTAADVHSLAVDRLVTQAVRAVALAVADATPAPHRYDGTAAADAAVSARGRRVMNDALFAQVAAIARAYPDDTIGQIRRQLHCSMRTAYRWLAAARGRGLLDEAKEER